MFTIGYALGTFAAVYAWLGRTIYRNSTAWIKAAPARLDAGILAGYHGFTEKADRRRR